MVDMTKLKEDALKRKREHEAKQREQQLRKENRGRHKPRPTRRTRNTSQRQATGKTSPQRAARPVRKKRSGKRWVMDGLLLLGALLVLLMLFNPYS